MNINSLDGFYTIRKPKKLPKRLIYHRKVKTPLEEKYDVFKMFSTQTGHELGMLATLPDVKKIELSSYYPKGDWKPSLYIMDLHSFERDKGVGTMFINFAKILSEKLGMHGRLHLISSDMYDKSRPPHIFYRKQGFTSRNVKRVKEMDEYLLGQASDLHKFHSLRMYYNPNAKLGEYEDYVPPKRTIKEKVIESLKDFILDC